MEAVSSIMKSGIFTDLIGGMNNGLSNGSLDLGKLMGAVQGMVGKLSEQTNSSDSTGSGSESDNPMNMLTTMIGSLSGTGGQPDLTGLMQMMQGGGGGGDQPDIAGIMQVMMKTMGQNQGSNNEIVKIKSDDLD